MHLIDWLMIVCGIVYIVKPNIFRRGKWRETSYLQRHLTPQSYTLVMRLLGLACIVWGLYGLLRHQQHY